MHSEGSLEPLRAPQLNQEIINKKNLRLTPYCKSEPVMSNVFVLYRHGQPVVQKIVDNHIAEGRQYEAYLLFPHCNLEVRSMVPMLTGD